MFWIISWLWTILLAGNNCCSILICNYNLEFECFI